jgi:hypothetical protein
LKSELNSLNEELAFPQSAFTTNESLGLNFSMAMNATFLRSGEAISITLNETNTLPHFNNITASNNWVYSGFPEQECSNGPGLSNLPIAMAIVQGYYSESDLNGTTSLPILSAPGGGVCPTIFFIPPSEYDFYPSSNVAAIVSNYGTLFFNVQNESISTSLSFSGYYNSSYPNTETIKFSPGVYTVIGGDEWGELVLLHFVVI